MRLNSFVSAQFLASSAVFACTMSGVVGCSSGSSPAEPADTATPSDGSIDSTLDETGDANLDVVPDGDSTIDDTTPIDSATDTVVDTTPLSPSKLTIWANEGGDKVSQDELRASVTKKKTTNSNWDGTTIRAFGAKNEVVSFNVIAESPTEDTPNVSVSLDTLVGPGGATIGSKAATGDAVFDWTQRNVELFYVRYLQIKGLSAFGYENYYDERHIPERFRRPWTGKGAVDAKYKWTDRPDHDKFYPDIAVPLELVPTFTIAKGQNQSIWCDIYIPKTATQGIYTGRLTVSESGKATHSIPVELNVRKFTLPDVANAKTMLFRGEDANKRYFTGTPSVAETTKLRDRHFMLAHRHKIAMIDSIDAATDDQPSAEWAKRLDGSLFTKANGYAGPGEATGNGVYAIGTYGSWSWKTSETLMRKHADAWATWFAKNAPDAEYFLYLIDEPPAAKFAEIEQWAKWIRNNPGPGRAMKSFATVSLLDAKASMPTLDIVASANYVGDPDLWGPAADAYAANPTKRFWMYNGMRPGQGTTGAEDDGVAMREVSWGSYKKKISRHFEWESTYYNDFQAGSGQTDVWNHAANFSGFPYTNDPVKGEWGFNHSNTNGILFFPGTDVLFPKSSYGVKYPIASLRLKHWRRGIQDVDYLALAAAKDPATVQAIVQSIVPKVIWENGVDSKADPTYVHTDVSWSNDPDVWEAARVKLADIIER